MFKTHFLNGNNESRLLNKKFANKLNKTKFAAKKRFLLQQFDQIKSTQNLGSDKFTTNQN